MVSQAWALPNQSLESLEYLTHQGVAAVEISFSQPVQYLSHFPLESGAMIEVFIGPRTAVDLDINQLPYTQAMRAPSLKELPLSQVTFRINESGEASLVIDFEKVVHFSVSAGRSPNTLLIVLPSHNVAAAVQMKYSQVINEVSSPALKLLMFGRKALKLTKNKKAIQIFTKMLGMPESAERQEALELLGVARERNGQKAHAKAMYREYLKQYPKSKSAARVKQRLSDLLHGQLKPKPRLKAVKKYSSRKSASRVYGSFAQYYYRGEDSAENAGAEVDQSLLLNQLSVNWRIRNADYEIRNFIYLNHSHDFVGKSEKEITPQTAYSQIKHSRLGFSGKVGRQRGSRGGVLGKFDGVSGSYDMTRNIGMNMVFGYPVDFMDKRDVQVEKPFLGFGFELDGEGENIDVLPYYIRQEVDGIVDREAVGSEFRFFHKQLGNFYSLVDYDVAYSDLNMYFFRGQYNWRKNTTLNANFDYRNNPLLFTSNALIGRVDVKTIKDLLETHSESQIRELAENRVGNSTTISLGVSHTINPQYQWNVDVTRAQQVFVIDTATPGVLSSERNMQAYLSAQLIANKWFNGRDTNVLGARISRTDDFDELSLSVSNRLPLENKWKFDTRLRIDMHQSHLGEDLKKYRPSVKWDFRPNRTMYYEAEIGMEFWRYSGETNNSDYQRKFINLGYRWNF